MIYFDANATTPLRNAARDAWLAAQRDNWANPASHAAGGVRAALALDECRARLAARLPAGLEIVFNSGATEGNNAVLAYEAARLGAGEVAGISAFEHASVRAPAQKFFGARLHVFNPLAAGEGLPVVAGGLPVIAGGGLPVVGFLSMMAVHNETGVIFPVREIRALAPAARLHCDATQAFGKIPPAQLRELLDGCDYITGSAHKFGGPKGVGFLAFSPASAPAFAGQLGGGQENHRRAGTANLADAAAMLAALDEVEGECAGSESAGSASRDAFECAVVAGVPGVRVIGAEQPRVWNTSLLLLPKHENIRWLKRLEKHGFVVGTGAACSALDGTAPALAPFGVNAGDARRVIRVSGYWANRPADWLALADAFAAVWHEL